LREYREISENFGASKIIFQAKGSTVLDGGGLILLIAAAISLITRA
jgi:hypothetical protein